MDLKNLLSDLLVGWAASVIFLVWYDVHDTCCIGSKSLQCVGPQESDGRVSDYARI